MGRFSQRFGSVGANFAELPQCIRPPGFFWKKPPNTLTSNT